MDPAGSNELGISGRTAPALRGSRGTPGQASDAVQQRMHEHGGTHAGLQQHRKAPLIYHGHEQSTHGGPSSADS